MKFCGRMKTLLLTKWMEIYVFKSQFTSKCQIKELDLINKQQTGHYQEVKRKFVRIRILFVLLSTGIAYGQHNHVKHDSVYIEIYTNIVTKARYSFSKHKRKNIYHALKQKKITKEQAIQVRLIFDSVPSYIQITGINGFLKKLFNDDTDLLGRFNLKAQDFDFSNSIAQDSLFLEQQVKGSCYKSKIIQTIPSAEKRERNSTLFTFSQPLYTKDKKSMLFHRISTQVSGHPTKRIYVYKQDDDGFWCPVKSIEYPK